MTAWLAVAAVFLSLVGLWVLGSVAFDAMADAYRRHVDLAAIRRARRWRR